MRFNGMVSISTLCGEPQAYFFSYEGLRAWGGSETSPSGWIRFPRRGIQRLWSIMVRSVPQYIRETTLRKGNRTLSVVLGLQNEDVNTSEPLNTPSSWRGIQCLWSIVVRLGNVPCLLIYNIRFRRQVFSQHKPASDSLILIPVTPSFPIGKQVRISKLGAWSNNWNCSVDLQDCLPLAEPIKRHWQSEIEY